jgi:hypothetical protein
MAESRHYQIMLIDNVPPSGEYPVQVEGVYTIEGSGWLWDFTLATGERVLAAAPMLSVVGTDIKAHATDLNKMRGVKVPLPKHIRQIIEPTDELRMLPVKKLLYSRECTLEVEDKKIGPPGEELQLATLTTTTDQPT